MRTQERANTIQVSDLFRPYVDDDDHFDLAVQYALHLRGDIHLSGIVSDFNDGLNRAPDAIAVAQLNYVTGSTVPFAVGSSQKLATPEDAQKQANRCDHGGSRFILDVLQTSETPVAMHITGSCRDVALASIQSPSLFKEKCKAIYLNAGVSTNDPDLQKQLDYNVSLDPAAYQAIWNIPCPVFWLPVHHHWASDGQDRRRQGVTEHASYYFLEQRRLLPHLSNNVKVIMHEMFERTDHSNWLRPILTAHGFRDENLSSHMSRIDEKWCTAGFIHGAGMTVTEEGEINRRVDEDGGSVYSFVPIEIDCNENAVTTWRRTSEQSDRFILRVNRVEQYQEAMVNALIQLLSTLP